MQVYEKVAAAYKGEKDVVIAKLDADAHSGLGEKYVLLQTFQISSVLSMVVFVDCLRCQICFSNGLESNLFALHS